MRSTAGWVKLNRSIQDHWIGQNVTSLGLFCQLLLWANSKPSQTIFDGKLTIIERGALITSTLELAARLDIHRNTVSKYLKLMEEDGTISQVVGNRGRIITICKYIKYQSIENDGRAMSTTLKLAPGVASDTTPPYACTKNTKKERIKEERGEQLTSEVQDFLAEYQKIFLEAYRTPAILSDQDLIYAKEAVRLSPDAKDALDFYFDSKHTFYFDRRHPIKFFVEDLIKFTTAFAQKRARLNG